jgi:hypothetical protein
MDLISIVKQLESLGMVGLSLLVAAGLAWVLVKRETEGLHQLKGAIEALTRAVETLQKSADKTLSLADDVRSVKADVELLKTAIVHTGVRSITKD